jgi:hypothetical protein
MYTQDVPEALRHSGLSDSEKSGPTILEIRGAMSVFIANRSFGTCGNAGRENPCFMP